MFYQALLASQMNRLCDIILDIGLLRKKDKYLLMLLASGKIGDCVFAAFYGLWFVYLFYSE